jgi:hypothetical protein
MVETYEFQLFSKYLPLLGDIGRRPHQASIATTLSGVVGDPLFIRIGELDQRLRKSREGVAFGSWNIKRSYSEEELARAQLFSLTIPLTHLSAEEYGTRYEDSGDCDCDAEILEHVRGVEFRVVHRRIPCGLYSKQLDPLRVPFSKLNRREDLYRLWGGELIVSEHFASLINSGEASGGLLFPISDAKNDDLTSPIHFSASPAGLEILAIAAGKNMAPADWSFWLWLNSDAQRPLLEKMRAQAKPATRKSRKTRTDERDLAQLILRSNQLQVSELSRFGATPFDHEGLGHHKCDAGKIAGLRPISPISVIRSSWDGSDLCRTGVYVSQRQGLFRPYQLFIVSRKIIEALSQPGMKEIQFEVVEMV